jgi:Tfp pilus assembly protein PilZ
MTQTSPVAVEQRHCERTLYPDLRIICNGLAANTETRPPDLSPDGIFINTPLAFTAGDTLQLRFDLVCTGTVIEAQGKVRYWIPGVGLGIKFIDLPSACRDAIERELDWKKTGINSKVTST